MIAADRLVDLLGLHILDHTLGIDADTAGYGAQMPFAEVAGIFHKLEMEGLVLSLHGGGQGGDAEPVVAELDYLRPLSSAAALALADELGELMDEGLATWLRRDSDDETLLRDATAPDARLALVVAMTILGLAGRERIALFVGRYKAWGRGGKKMPETTRGFEVALDTRPDQDSDEPPLETQVLALAQPGDESPIALDALIDTITEDRGAERFLATLDVEGEPDLDAAREAWRRVQKDETELVMRLIQHVLPDRPRTIGVTESAE